MFLCPGVAVPWLKTYLHVFIVLLCLLQLHVLCLSLTKYEITGYWNHLLKKTVLKLDVFGMLVPVDIITYT